MSSVAVASNQKTYSVAVVGATGAVGMEMIRMLENRHFPIKELQLFASERSAGKALQYLGKSVSVKNLDSQSIPSVDVAIFSAGATISKQFAPLFAAKGAFVIDNSSAWRSEPDIPLVVPEVNPHILQKEKKIIANPNCSTIQMVVALKPIHDVAKIKSIRVATYQAVSGAGSKGIHDLENQSKAWAQNSAGSPAEKFPYPIAFNLIPQIDVFTENGYTKEEMKMANETRKIMELPNLPVSATCVRVPVFRSHSEAVWIELEKKLSVGEVKILLSKSPGITLEDEPEKSIYPMPINAAEKQSTYVGRIRADLACPNGLSLWIVSDNLLKGAALNAVEIAELLIKKSLI
jgi:aspartate-semialdehyde dehydrogenase